MSDKFEKNDFLNFGSSNSADAINDLPDDLLQLEAELKKMPVPALSQNETAEFYMVLDSELDKVDNRAGGLYGTLVRYGAALMTIVLLVGISFVADVKHDETLLTTDNSEYYYFDSYSGQIAVTEELDDEYIDMIVNSQVRSYGFDISEEILGEITDDELQLLEESFDVGALL